MKLKYKYTSKDEIPEGAADFYSENDEGEFILQVSGVKSPSDFSTVEKSLKKERQIRKQYESIAKDLGIEVDEDGDYDLSEIKQAVNAYENRRTADGEETIDGETKEQIEERVRSKMMREIEKKDERINELSGDLKNILIEDGLKDALMKHGVTNPAYLKAAKKLHRDEVEIKEIDGEKQAVAGVLEEPLDKYVGKWVESDDGKPFVTAKQNSGGGSNSGGGGGGSEANPFKKDTFSLAKIAELCENNLEKAKTMAAEAGVPLERYYSPE